jgi:hypothetical protein
MAAGTVKFVEATRTAFQSKPFQIFLIVVIVAAIIYFAGRKAGKEGVLAPKPLPDSGQGVPTNWEPQRDAIVKELFDAMDGYWVLSGTKETAWKKLHNLTRDQLTAVYNEYNRLYQDKGQGTLYQWINDELSPPRWLSEAKDKAMTLLEQNSLT